MWFKASAAIVEVYEVMPCTLTNFQMKLFTSIAATAAVIGTSYIANTPAEARNGWVYVGKYTRNNGAESNVYERYLGCNDSICTYERIMSHWDSPYRANIDCMRWQTFGENYSDDIMPGSNAERVANLMCR